jgi:small-conductance mechanosensitive channel
MNTVTRALDMAYEAMAERAPQLLAAALVLLVVSLLGSALGLGISRLMQRTDRTGRYARVARRLVRWLMVGLGLVLALHVLGLTAVATSLLATGGLMAVILGFAFKDIGENLLAGVFLAFSRSFDVGDLIESGGLRGVVKSIDLRDTHIRTGDGCDIFIPSASIYRNPLLNFTRDGLRRASFTIGIDYRDDADEALRLLRKNLPEVSGVLRDPEPLVEISELGGAWVELGVHVWADTFSEGGVVRTRTAAMAAARRVLAEAGFTFSSEVTTALDLPPVDVRVGSPGGGS